MTKRTRALFQTIAISIGLGTLLTILTGAPTLRLWLVTCGFTASMSVGLVLGVNLRYMWEKRRSNPLGFIGLFGLIVLFGVSLFYLGALADPIIGNSENQTLLPSMLALSVVGMALAARPPNSDLN